MVEVKLNETYSINFGDFHVPNNLFSLLYQNNYKYKI